MSTIEEYTTTPWISPTSCRNCLSLLVLSSNDVVINNISEALLDAHAMGDFRWKLVVLRSFSMEDVARNSAFTGLKPSIDFVIIAVDSSEMFCLDWASKMLEQVQPDLRIRRVVLVNATGSAVNSMVVNPSKIINFCTENRLDMLTADVTKQEDGHSLAQRLLRYIEVSYGINTGIPNINV